MTHGTAYFGHAISYKRRSFDRGILEILTGNISAQAFRFFAIFIRAVTRSTLINTGICKFLAPKGLVEQSAVLVILVTS